MKEVSVPIEALSALEKALRDARIISLGTYGFLDVTVQPLGGMFSNPYADGEPVRVRIVREGYHEQNRRDARAFASCEAAYLEAPE